MKLNPPRKGAFTIAEGMIASAIFASASITIYMLLYNGTMLAAWNTASNVAHEQARTAMLQMVQDMHSAVSLPQLISDVDATTHDPVITSTSPATGVSFQLWSSGPFQIAADAAPTQNVVQITVPSGVQAPVPPPSPHQSPYQRLIVRSHEIEDDITSVDTSGGIVSLTLAHNLSWNPATNQDDPTRRGINGVSGTTYHVDGFVTDRCSYIVKEEPPGSGKLALKFYGPRLGKTFAVMGSSITNPTPFSTKNHATGTPYYQFVAAFDLSTAYGIGTTGRHSRSANILLRNEVPAYARLTNNQ